jgi:hypothetical protein
MLRAKSRSKPAAIVTFAASPAAPMMPRSKPELGIPIYDSHGAADLER